MIEEKIYHFYWVIDQSGHPWYITNSYHKARAFWLHKGGWPLYNVELI